MTEETEFMATWRDLRAQCGDDGERQQHVRQLMQSLLEQYGPELRQDELNECVADLDGTLSASPAAPTSTTDRRRSG